MPLDIRSECSCCSAVMQKISRDSEILGCPSWVLGGCHSILSGCVRLPLSGYTRKWVESDQHNPRVAHEDETVTGLDGFEFQNKTLAIEMTVEAFRVAAFCHHPGLRCGAMPTLRVYVNATAIQRDGRRVATES